MSGLSGCTPAGSLGVRSALALVALAVVASVSVPAIRCDETSGATSSEAAERAVLESIVEQGVKGPLTLHRDDSQAFILSVADNQRLFFFTVVEGGIVPGPDGRSSGLVVDHPRKWTAMINKENGTVYRLTGYRGNDFNDLVKDLAPALNKDKARVVAERFAELTFPESMVADESLVSVRAFIESGLAGAYEDGVLGPAVEQWYKRDYALLAKLRTPQVESLDGGFLVTLGRVAIVRRPPSTPAAELSKLVIQVTVDGQCSVVKSEVFSRVGPL